VWIETTLSQKLPKATLRESLLDGVVLCKLINALCPGALKRYHKQPRMLAMKIENIGFFLATCKTRMNLPPALLFQPTDIHDDSSNIASMSKVLNVLSFLKGDGESDMIQALPDDDDDEDGAEPKTETPNQPVENEPEPEPEPNNEPDPEPEPIGSTPVEEPPSTITNSTTSNTVSSKDDLSEVQAEVLKAINDVINAELTIESKRKLLKILQNQMAAFEDKIMNSSDEQLMSMLLECGIDQGLSKSKGRDATIELLLRHGRVQ